LALFWFLAGVLTTLATLVMLLPWLRMIPRLGSLPAVPWPVAAAAALSMALAFGLYRWLGHAELANQAIPTAAQNISAAAALANAPIASAGGENSATSSAGSMSSAIAALQARLAKGGGSADDWELLAKSYEFIGRPDDARKARAHELPPMPIDGSPSVPSSSAGWPPVTAAAPATARAAPTPTLSADSLKQLAKASNARRDRKMSEAAAIYAQLAAHDQLTADGWSDYADTAASLQGGKLTGAPEKYIANALAQNPLHPKALWLQASADEEAGRYDRAVLVWQRLQKVLPPDTADAKIVAANLQQDMALNGAAASTAGTGAGRTEVASAGAAAAPTRPAATSGAAVSGEVSLAAALSAKAAAGATLFIVAKSVDSPGMPVAVFRGSVGAWPVKFTLDDSQSMLPGRNLSSAGRVTIEARISQSGQPMPAAGDLQGSSGVINPSDGRPLKIVIDHVIS
jgi:cytochrome c-type biogenesis protein CcmH/NrfG